MSSSIVGLSGAKIFFKLNGVVHVDKFDQNWDEHYIRQKKGGGSNSLTFYIIRRQDISVGLFSNYIVFAGHIRYALAQGWLPVIDMQNYPNTYLEPELIGKVFLKN